MTIRVCYGLCVFLLVAGCSGIVPMPDRLGDVRQNKLDDGWSRVASGEAGIDREYLLDIIIVTNAWHVGVDRLDLRVERSAGAGTVVMETHYDRRTPEADRFVVTFHDAAGRPIRSETYSREALVDAARVSLASGSNCSSVPTSNEDESPEQAAIREALRARLARVRQLFPNDVPPTRSTDEG